MGTNDGKLRPPGWKLQNRTERHRAQLQNVFLSFTFRLNALSAIRHPRRMFDENQWLAFRLTWGAFLFFALSIVVILLLLRLT